MFNGIQYDDTVEYMNTHGADSGSSVSRVAEMSLFWRESLILPPVGVGILFTPLLSSWVEASFPVVDSIDQLHAQ